MQNGPEVSGLSTKVSGEMQKGLDERTQEFFQLEMFSEAFRGDMG